MVQDSRLPLVRMNSKCNVCVCSLTNTSGDLSNTAGSNVYVVPVKLKWDGWTYLALLNRNKVRFDELSRTDERIVIAFPSEEDLSIGQGIWYNLTGFKDIGIWKHDQVERK